MRTSPEETRSPTAWRWRIPGVDLKVVLLVSLHLAVTLPLAVTLSVWVDEAYSLHSTSGSLGETFTRALWFEQQAPAYFLLLDLWRKANVAPVFARLLSVVFIACTLFAAARLSNRVFPGKSPAWLVGILAFNPVLVWAAVEIRPYPMAILIATLVLLAFYATVGSAFSSCCRTICLALAGAWALYTQYYLGFLLTALGVALVVTGSLRDLVRYAVAMGGVVIACLPIAFWLPGQLGALSGASAHGFEIREAAGFWLHEISVALIPGYELLVRIGSTSMHQAIVWGVRVGVAAAAIGLLLATGGVRRLFRDSSAVTAWIALICGAAAFAGLGLFSDSSLVVAHRHWSFLSIPAAVAWMSIAVATGRRNVLTIVVGLTVGLNVLVLVDAYWPLAKEGDAKRVADFLTSHERPNEPILVFPNELALPLRLYYSGVNQIVPVPREVSLEVYDPRNAAIASEEELVRLLKQVESEAATLWLVRRETTGYRGVVYGVEILDEVVAARYSVTVKEDFFDGVTVLQLDPRPRDLHRGVPAIDGID